MVEHYSDTLMKHKRGSLAKDLTRDKVLDFIELSEEEFIKNGASINKWREFLMPMASQHGS